MDSSVRLFAVLNIVYIVLLLLIMFYQAQAEIIPVDEPVLSELEPAMNNETHTVTADSESNKTVNATETGGVGASEATTGELSEPSIAMTTDLPEPEEVEEVECDTEDAQEKFMKEEGIWFV